MKRRAFLTLLGGAAAPPLLPPLVCAQQALPVIGFLSSSSAWESAPQTEAFRHTLGEMGYADGRNVLIDYRFADGHYERLPILAAELVRRPVTVIAALGTPAAPAAKAATASIPIVFRIAVDPVELGLVASYSRPGGNLTGVVSLNTELESKRLEVLHEVVPAMKVVALLLNPDNPNADGNRRNMQAAARARGLELHVTEARAEREFDAGFARMVEAKAGGLVVGSDPFYTTRYRQLSELALRHKLPAISGRDFTRDGGLMGYGASAEEPYRVAGLYTGRILKGEKPADLPVQQVTKIELIVNMKIARALGVAVPLQLLGRADEVIE